jgi:hypothetical protein
MTNATNEADALPVLPTHVPPHHTRHPRPPSTSESARIAELEYENARLQRLVAELLLKNQQLRKCD